MVEIGYQGDGGYHLQRAHLINNPQPGPGLLQPRRPFKSISFVPNTIIPSDVTVASLVQPVSTINLLEGSARSWYDAGWVDVRRRFSHGLTFLTNLLSPAGITAFPDPGELFNALNHTNYGTPNRFVNEPQFGTTMAMHPGREAQFSARMTF